MKNNIFKFGEIVMDKNSNIGDGKRIYLGTRDGEHHLLIHPKEEEHFYNIKNGAPIAYYSTNITKTEKVKKMKKLNIDEVLKNFDNNEMTVIVTNYLHEEPFETITEIIEFIKVQFQDHFISDIARDVDLFEEFNDLPWLSENPKTFDDYIKERGYATQATIFENITFAKKYENELTLKKIVKDLLEYLENSYPLFDNGEFRINDNAFVQYVKAHDKIFYIMVMCNDVSDVFTGFVWDDGSIKTEQDLKDACIESLAYKSKLLESCNKDVKNDC